MCIWGDNSYFANIVMALVTWNFCNGDSSYFANFVMALALGIFAKEIVHILLILLWPLTFVIFAW